MKRSGSRNCTYIVVIAMLMCRLYGSVSAQTTTNPGNIVYAFEAVEEAKCIRVAWRTAGDVDGVGFFLYRRKGTGATEHSVTARMLPSLHTEPAGGIYTYRDPDVKPGSVYVYELERVDLRGNRRRCGLVGTSFSGTASGETAALLPSGGFGGIDGYLAHSRVKRPDTTVPRELHSRAPLQGLPADRVKLEVRDPGIYYVSPEALATPLGTTSADVAARLANGELRLWRAGRRSAFMPADDGGLWFYYEGFESSYSDLDVFWLEPGRSWVLPETVAVAPDSQASDRQWFRHTAHFEDDAFFATAMNDWYWIYLSPGLRVNATTNTLTLTGVSGDTGRATLRLRFVAASDSEQRLTFKINDQVVGERLWQGTGHQAPEFAFDQALLRDGTNTLAILGEPWGGYDYCVVYVDDFSIAYNRLYTARDDRLTAPVNGHQVLTFRGFSGSDIQIADVSDPHWPRRVTGARIDSTNGESSVSFVPLSSNAVYAVHTLAAARTPDSVRGRRTPTLRSATNAADYVLITRNDMVATARRLALHRQSNGWQTAVVDLEDVYDAFTWGRADPSAITRFLGHASDHWRVRPTHVVLGGSASFDYKNIYAAQNPKTVIPTIMAQTPFGYFSADNRLADFEGDNAPDVAIGRLPAVTVAELDQIVRRQIAHELTVDGAWTTSTVWVADNPEAFNPFDTDSDNVSAGIPASHSVTKFYLSAGSAPEPPYFRATALKPLLRSALSSGCGLLNYRGHGNWNVWASESLLTLSDVRAMANGVALPFVVIPSCQINWQDHPLVRCMGEEFLLCNGGGAAAVWAPSGPSYNTSATLIDTFYVEAAYASGAVTLGDAVRDALKAFSALNRERFEIDIFTLLGDPATPVR